MPKRAYKRPPFALRRNDERTFVEYADGTCVVANGSTAERLKAVVNGRACSLPPRAFKAWTRDGRVCAEISEGEDGKRHYFSDCPEFTFRDGTLTKKTESPLGQPRKCQRTAPSE